MDIVLRLAPVEYRDGMVFQRMGWVPIADSGVIEVKSAKMLRVAIDHFLAPWRGANVDAKLVVTGTGRKFPGFDAERRFPREIKRLAHHADCKCPHPQITPAINCRHYTEEPNAGR